MKFAICNEIFEGWKLDEVLWYCAELGYDAVEVAPYTLARYVTDIPAEERKRIREVAAKHGIAISGIHWVLVQTEGLHLTSPDAATRARTAAYFRELVDFCADIGGKYVIVGSPKQRSLAPGVTHAQGWAWAQEVFRPCVARAAKRGVTVCLEPLPREDTNFINTAEEAMRFTREAGSPNFKLILDVRAMSHETGKSVPQVLRESAGHFAYVHANDKNLRGPGFGTVDFVPIMVTLRNLGYDGVVSIEVFRFDEGAEVISRRCLKYLRTALEDAAR